MLNIILPSAAIEHKTVAGPFARKFPKAQLWVSPNQVITAIHGDSAPEICWLQLRV